jgi:HK97 family phage prohead protease
MTDVLALGGGRLALGRGRGVFEGYASLFGVPDSAGDVVMAGAFAASLARRGTAGIRMLFQHDAGRPIGTWLDLGEDSRGLFVRGRLAAEVQQAEELGNLLHAGAIDGLSIGFRAVLATRDRATRQRLLTRVDLWEISLVTFPMLEGARVTALGWAPTAPLRKSRSRDGPWGPGSGAPDDASAIAAAIRAGARQLFPFPSSGAMR